MAVLFENAPLLAPLVFIGKVILFLIGMVWVRATLPRFRYDRLMMFGVEGHAPTQHCCCGMDGGGGGHW
ncbi:MAG UNVERIFIED_CONTAM: NADH-quinone oxidoreductase subunit H [Anaerolineae bacterium]